MSKKPFFIACLVLFAVFAAGRASAEVKSPVLPVLLNILPGFGVGSFVQGDPIGGVVLLSAETVSLGVFVIGWIEMVNFLQNNLLNPDSGPNTWSYVALAGGIAYCVCKVVGIILPLAFRPAGTMARNRSAEPASTGSAAAPLKVSPRFSLDEKSNITVGVAFEF
jgi:hypothetical protein